MPLPSFWGIVLTKGIISLLLGIMVLVWPLATWDIILIIAAVYIMLMGILFMIGGIWSMTVGWEGIVGVILGILAFMLGIYILKNPGGMTLIGIYLLGLWLIIAGIYRMFADWDLVGDSKALTIFVGIISILVGILLLQEPIVNGLIFYWVLGLFLLISGAIYIALSFKIKHDLKKLTS